MDPKKAPDPRENASWLSKATFWFIIPTMIKGFKRDLDESDLYEILSTQKSDTLGDRLEIEWRLELKRAFQCGRQPSMHRTLCRMFYRKYILTSALVVAYEAVKYSQPVLVGLLLRYLNNLEQAVDQSKAYLYAALLISTMIIYTMMIHPYLLQSLHIGFEMRIALGSLVYRKSLRLKTVSDIAASKAVNILGSDVFTLNMVPLCLNILWFGPLEIIITTIIMYKFIGVSVFTGLAFTILFIPTQFGLGILLQHLRKKTAARADERIRIMNEIISGMQVIKMYAWEKPFANLICKARACETFFIRKSNIIKGINVSLSLFSTKISLFITLVTHVLLGNELTAEKVFVTTCCYGILRLSVTAKFADAVNYISQANVALERIKTFCLLEEKEEDYLISNILQNKNTITPLRKWFGSLAISKNIDGIKPFHHVESLDHKKEHITNVNDPKKERDLGVVFSNASAKWSKSSEEDTIKHISLNVNPEKLLIVVGSVGSGKTSLLHTILKEMPLTTGSLTVEGSISYASQEPWVFSATIRENILLGSPMNEARYEAVVRSCSLLRDFQLWPYGDNSLVGDKGITLSGGQKARVNLARAVYREADIYLLDDPLSAVDAQVGGEIFKHCIKGFLKGKIVILVTHHLQYLNLVDQIIYLDNGTIKAQGTYEDIILDKNFEKLHDNNSTIEEILNNNENSLTSPEERDYMVSNKIMSMSNKVQNANMEQRSHGAVKSNIFIKYAKACGNWGHITALLASFILVQVFSSGANYFSSYWVDIQKNQSSLKSQAIKINKTATSKVMKKLNSTGNLSREENPDYHFQESCIYIYSVITLLVVITSICRSIYLSYLTSKASVNIHNTMFDSLKRASMKFFYTNSSGRILNRFSKDMNEIDENFPSDMLILIQTGLLFVGGLVVIVSVNLWLFLPTSILIGVGILFREFYIRASRSLKRIEGTTRSPVFSHVNATLDELTTVRAFQAEKIAIKQFDEQQNLNSSALLLLTYCIRGMSYWVDLLCSVYSGFIIFSLMTFLKGLSTAYVGLAITEGLDLLKVIRQLFLKLTQIETSVISLERILEYSDIDHEIHHDITLAYYQASQDWPVHGKLEYRRVFLWYDKSIDPILRDVSFTISPNEKIGIVGRTGTGKSSLIIALFRLALTEGTMLIDGVDISNLKLETLRKSISIIPQNPVIFSGTLRTNLDPFNKYTDADIWRALELVRMKNFVEGLDAKFDTKISNGSRILSNGRKQLICIARAILRKNKILILDEATSNVDMETDSLIQHTIKTVFDNCTVITIAHRLHTVMQSDKILVMHAGQVVEFDHPEKLLQKKNGYLRKILQITGNITSKNLSNITKENYVGRKTN